MVAYDYDGEKINDERDMGLVERAVNRLFVYDVDNGFREFNTKSEMKEWLEKVIDEYKEIAVSEGEWPEEIEFIRYGKIDGCVKSVD